MGVIFDSFGLTDRGKVREANEDQFLIADLAKSMKVFQTSLPQEDHTRLFGAHHGQILLVADGMGGHAGGQRASGVAVKTVADYVLNTMPWFFNFQDGKEEEMEKQLRTLVEECQRSVKAAGQVTTGERRMGTTLTMAYLLWPRLYVVHAGDSRCYLLRQGKVHQVTRDHTVAQKMVDQGLLSPAEAEHSRWSHVLWNCVGGGSDEISPDVYKATLQKGDSLMLCTDGLSKYVTGERIAALLGGAASTEQVARNLVDEANAAGGSDNVTVVVARTRPTIDVSSPTPVDGTSPLSREERD